MYPQYAQNRPLRVRLEIKGRLQSLEEEINEGRMRQALGLFDDTMFLSRFDEHLRSGTKCGELGLIQRPRAPSCVLGKASMNAAE